jgi:hypothetical protein
MKRGFFAVFAALLISGCNTKSNVPDADLYLYAGNKVVEYYGFDSYKLDLTECDYSLPSIIYLDFRETRINEARADYLTGSLSKADYDARITELLDGCASIAAAWKNNIPDTTDRRIMFKCEADSGIVFNIVIDKDNKTPVCSTMDIEKKYAEIRRLVESFD